MKKELQQILEEQSDQLEELADRSGLIHFQSIKGQALPTIEGGLFVTKVDSEEVCLDKDVVALVITPKRVSEEQAIELGLIISGREAWNGNQQHFPK